MTAKASAARPAATPPRLRPGWMTIAGKEFTDHLLSIRLYVLMIVLGIAALIPLYFAAETIRSVADAASGSPAVFLALFVLSPENVSLLRFIKREQTDVKNLVKKIAADSAAGAKLLEEFARHDPFDQTG